MSNALEELRKKEVNDDVELCILYWGDEQTASDEDMKQANRAAKKYAALQARVTMLEKRLRASQGFARYGYFDHINGCNPKHTGACTCGFWDARDMEVKTALELQEKDAK